MSPEFPQLPNEEELTNMKDHSILTQIAISLARIEVQVNNSSSELAQMGKRLTDLEKTVTILEAQKPVKTPWTAFVAGIASILSIALSSIVLIQFIQFSEKL